MKKLTTEEFILRAYTVHGDKYDYSKVNYINSRTPICIICKDHGEFWQRSNSHLNGSGCAVCGVSLRSAKNSHNTSYFICNAIEIHGDRYDYSNVEYKGCYEKVGIICPTHGTFWQRAYSHLNGHGCPICAGKGIGSNNRFIQKATSIHGELYDYSKVEYINNKTKVCIICPIHGEFWQLPGGSHEWPKVL